MIHLRWNDTDGRKKLVVVLMVCCFSLTGCMVGYKTFKTEPYNAVQPTASLSHVKISYSVDKPILRFSLERAIRGQFNIFDTLFYKDGNIPSEPERFILKAQLSEGSDSLATKNIWFVISTLSCAVIPAVANEESTLIFTIMAPEGKEKSFRYTYSERWYTWLPFLFAGPGYIISSGHGVESSDYHQERIKILDAITTRFMIDAAPFILSHSTLTMH